MTATASAQLGHLEDALPGEWAALLLVLVGMALLGGLVLTAASVAHERTLTRREARRQAHTRAAISTVSGTATGTTAHTAAPAQPVPVPAGPAQRGPFKAAVAVDTAMADEAAADAPVPDTPRPADRPRTAPTGADKVPTHSLPPVHRPHAAAGRLPYSP